MATILFPDGNHALRSVLSECLRNDGYTVLEAADSAQAERACSEKDGPIDVSMNVLYIGGPEWKSRLQDRRKPKSGWLEKPFTDDALAKSGRNLAAAAHASDRERIQ